jgi:hypothetical protein
MRPEPSWKDWILIPVMLGVFFFAMWVLTEAQLTRTGLIGIFGALCIYVILNAILTTPNRGGTNDGTRKTTDL